MQRLTLGVTVLAAACCANASGASMYFDFGNGAFEAGGNYNQVYSAVTHTVPDAKDSTGAPTGVQLVTSGFHEFGGNESGTGSPGAPADDFVANATIDSLYGHTGNWGSASPRTQGSLAFSGLDGSGATSYDFVIFASRMGVGDIRDALYTVTGANSDSAVLDAGNNSSQWVVIPDIVPTAAGEISMTVEKGPNNNNGVGFFYLGAMRVDSSAVVPEPAGALLLLLGLGAVTTRLR